MPRNSWPPGDRRAELRCPQILGGPHFATGDALSVWRMLHIPLPTPPPMPGPLPTRIIDSDAPLDGPDEALHRLAQLHDACPRCSSAEDDQSWDEWLRSWADPDPIDFTPHFDHWLTPEGELAGFDHGEFRVDDPVAFTDWADQHFRKTGKVWVHVVDLDGRPWTRAVFWLEDGRIKLQAASLGRYFHLERGFERLWPPVYRGFRSAGAFHGPDLARQIREHPPAEVSPYTQLIFRRGTGETPDWMTDVSHVIPSENGQRDDPRTAQPRRRGG